jgi:putative colanic acid biosynthesis UDP-glucose lipid carrier transferase
MNFVKGRYSWIIRPLLIILDMGVIATGVIFCFTHQVNYTYFLTFELLSWILIAYSLAFYEVYRFTSVLKIGSLLSKQFLLFTVSTFAYFGIFNEQENPFVSTLVFLGMVMLSVTTIKLGTYYLLRKYREKFDGNTRNVLVFGKSEAASQLRNFFEKKKYLGYKLMKVHENGDYMNPVDFIKSIREFPIDEIYCALDDLNDEDINEFIQFADAHYCNLKFIPTSQKLFTKRLKTDYYEYQPVLSLPKPSINITINAVSKRIFDIFFSLFVILCILSWMTPLLAILIYIDSKGPIFYKHKRHGLNYKEFWCYKFRTLKKSGDEQLKQVTKNDARVTRIGRFLRKTSFDEFPQFINVLLGDMSVVGPRPHMIEYTKSYSKKLDKLNFVFRHSVKPGITGLAQVKGYRGEISADEDLINRFKYDVFYIENWSLLLDLKIIFLTILNILKGEAKAY